MTTFQKRITRALNGEKVLTAAEREYLMAYDLTCDAAIPEELEEVATIELKSFIESFGAV